MGNIYCAIRAKFFFDDGKYVLISEIYDTRQLRPRGLFDNFNIYFHSFHLVLTVQFQSH